jgi:hypothetical protein
MGVSVCAGQSPAVEAGAEGPDVVQTTKVWAFGDRVVHSAKPEWGAGVVTSASKTVQDGKPCQMLTVRFDRAGVKNISTAYASLVPAESATRLVEWAQSGGAEENGHAGGNGNGNGNGKGGGGVTVTKDDEFLARLRGVPVEGDARARMTRLPDDATDPFSTALERFKATLRLYRFTPTGGSLLDWAAMQSGLADPMSRFNRHELEKFFEAFAVARDNHLKKVAFESKKADAAATALAARQAPAPAQQALRRLDALR